MRTPQRRLDPPLIVQLVEAPQRFEFFQAVRLLDRLFAKQPGGHTRRAPGLSTRIRFRNTLNQAFATAEIEALRVEGVEGLGAGSLALATRVEITPSFAGLLGVHGALPSIYTERISERESLQRDRAARALLDLFTDRATALFYGAWKKHRLALQYESDPLNQFLPLVLSFAGLGFDALRDRLATGPGEIDDESIAGMAGILSQRPLSAIGLQRLLSRHFGVPIGIEQFVGKWYLLPTDQRCVLGGCGATLGRTSVIGQRVWQRDLRVRLRIGPLAASEYRAFLPGGHRAEALAKILALVSGAQFEYELRPVLRAEDVVCASLSTERPARLGRDTFVLTRSAEAPRSDAMYEINSLH